MFAEACAKATQFTKPMVISTATVDGKVDSGYATYVIINSEGWAVTAFHCVQCVLQQHNDENLKREVDAYNAQNPDEKRTYNPKWLKANSVWWGNDNIRYDTMHFHPALDLAFVRLTNLPHNFVTDYPVFKEPSAIRPGMSLCRIGYPFTKAKATYDPESTRFALGLEGGIPQWFPYEGMLTRQIVGIPLDANGKPVKIDPNEPQPMFVECSTPGLVGQSGGPIIDKNGYIVGIQSKTNSIPLGFGDKQVDGKYMPEQFINLGVGVHVSTIIQAMKKHGIKYKSESDDDGYRIVG